MSEEKNVWTKYIKPKYKKTKKRKFSIKNYRSIKQLNIKLDNLTILVGENASGKSNVLKYINAYCMNFFDLKDLLKSLSYQFSSQANAIISKYRSKHEEMLFLPLGINNIDLLATLEEDKEIYKYQTPFMITKELPIESSFKIGKYIEEGEDPYKIVENKIQRDIFRSFKYDKMCINNIDDTLPFFSINLDITNLNEKNVEKLISDRLLNFIDIGFNIYEEQNDIYSLLSFIPNIKSNINYVLSNIIKLRKKDKENNLDKEISIYLALKYDLNVNEINTDGFQILIRDEAENKIFPPHMKSSGINNIITIVSTVEFLKYLIKNYPDKNYDKLNYLFNIDEPELYLHPRIQKNLISYLYEASNEIKEIHILLATHSPYMMHPNTVNSTYLVEYDVTYGTTAKKLIDIVDNNEEKYSVLSPIEDSLGLTFNEFLHPIIFVEGEEELDVFRRISNIYTHTKTIHNLKGKSKLPSIALLMEKFKTRNEKFKIFIDADFSFKEDFKYIDNARVVLNNLSDHVYFIGKEIYTFNNYGNLESKDECLEDFIIFNIFDDAEYTILTEIADEIQNKYFNISLNLTSVNSFLQVIEKIRGIIRSNKKTGTQFIKDEIISDNNMKNRKIEYVERIIETEIKENIKEKLLSNSDKFKKFEEKILEVLD